MLKQFLYTASFRLKIIKHTKKHGNRASERHFGPSATESVSRLWRKRAEKLLQMPRQKTAMRGKPPKWPEMDQEVTTWILEQVKLGFLFWPRWYTKKVKGLHEKKNPWFLRDTFTLHALTSWREKVWAWGHEWNLPQNFQQLMRLEFWNFIRMLSIFKRLATLSCPKSPVWMRSHSHLMCLPTELNRTVDVKGAKTVAVRTGGHEKTHFSVVWACCADGTKLPSMIIFKRKKHFQKKRFQVELLFTCIKKGVWMKKAWKSGLTKSDHQDLEDY